MENCHYSYTPFIMKKKIDGIMLSACAFDPIKIVDCNVTKKYERQVVTYLSIDSPFLQIPWDIYIHNRFLKERLYSYHRFDRVYGDCSRRPVNRCSMLSLKEKELEKGYGLHFFRRKP